MNFITEIIGWYQQNKRDLPWRNTSDPYIIWLSEIILQQTRVEQGMPYFHRFAERFPTVSDFAGADEEEILKLWQGLGYYSRGRNMHHTAQLVMEQHAGYFPRKYDELIKLKGVGEYTAAAISSFSSNEAKAVVDGNVFRLLSRYFGIHEPINSGKAKKIFTDLANEIIDKNQPGLSNQAIMEFGSLQCRPKNPLCESCVLRLSCQAYNEELTSTLPIKIKKVAVRNRFFNYVIAIKNKQILFSKRTGDDIWQNLYEFPLIESAHAVSSNEILRSSEFQNLFGENARIRSEHGPVKHLLSHQRIQVRYIFIEDFDDLHLAQKPWFYADIEDIDKLPSPKVIFAFLKNFHTLFT